MFMCSGNLNKTEPETFNSHKKTQLIIKFKHPFFV